MNNQLQGILFMADARWRGFPLCFRRLGPVKRSETPCSACGWFQRWSGRNDWQVDSISPDCRRSNVKQKNRSSKFISITHKLLWTPQFSWLNPKCPTNKPSIHFWFVVSTYPSEKYEFVSWDDEVPNKGKNKIHVCKPPIKYGTIDYYRLL